MAATLGGRATDKLGSRTVIVLDIGVQAALVARQTRAVAVDAAAQGRLNSLYMRATFIGGAVGVAISGWLMQRYGWTGVAMSGIGPGVLAGLIHLAGARAQRCAPSASLI